MTLIKSVQRYSTKYSAAWKVIIVDSSAELPAGEILKTYLSGSFALAIDTGKVYALNSSGSWIEQPNVVISV